MTPTGVPAVLMRGGTSKGLFLHARDIPSAGRTRDALLLELMGSPDPMQIDGLGGTYSSTSKVVVVDVLTEGVVRYLFGQVGIETASIDWSGNCGNLTTAVGPFAIDEGLVEAVEPVTQMILLNANTGVRIVSEVPVEVGAARKDGDHVVAGVPGTGAPIVTRYLDPAGGVLGSALPTGNVTDKVTTSFGDVTVSIVDVTHPYAFVLAEALGIIPGAVGVAELNADADLLRRLEELRGACAVLLGAVGTPGDAMALSPAVPRLVLVAMAQPTDRATLEVIAVSMGAVHRALPMTGALCAAAAAKIPGTVVNACATPAGEAVLIAHPRGVTDVLVDLSVGPLGGAASVEVRSVGIVRTARRLMAGTAYPRTDGAGGPR